MRKLLILIFLIYFLSNNLHSQVFKSFKDTTFVHDLDLFLLNDTRKEVLDVKKAISEAWNNNIFSANEKKDIIKITNHLHKKRIPKYPVITSYFSVLVNLKQKSPENFLVFTEKMLLMINSGSSTSSTFKKFIKQLHSLSSSGQIYSSKTTKWKASKQNYKLLLEKKTKKLKVAFADVDIECVQLKDTVKVISGTDGTYDPMTSKWTGKGGIVSWERNGYKKNEVYALLKDYDINMKETMFTVDSVTFVNKLILDKEITGSLS